MPAHARVWVYQASQDLTDASSLQIQQFLDANVATWAAHGAALTAAVKVLYNRFVILAVDEAQHLPSGCSIDASTHWFKAIEAQTGISFFDRSIAFLKDDEIQTVDIPKIKQAVSTSIITPETMVFNNLVATLEELSTKWQIPAAESWLKRYFVIQVA